MRTSPSSELLFIVPAAFEASTLHHRFPSHATPGGGLPQLLFRAGGNIFCKYAGVVGNRIGPLSERGTVLRVGNWLMGPAEDDADKFVISKLGTGEVIALLEKNGDVYVVEKVRRHTHGGRYSA